MNNQKLQICLEPRNISTCNSLPPELKFMEKARQLSVISNSGLIRRLEILN
ncbi:MAG: hypothetical protein AB4080_15670 [Trichodesmium sp.]